MNTREDGVTDITRQPDQNPRTIIERNFMTLPMFAADQHSLEGYSGIHLEGQLKHGGQYQAFRWATTLAPRAADGTTPSYPGPQCRAVHMALISLMLDHRKPWPQVIPFSMDRLRDRLGLVRGGRTYDQLRESIISTCCLALHSHDALYDFQGNRALTTALYHVYDWVCFQGEVLPDGRRADVNHVKLSDWLYAALVSLKGAITDFDLWLQVHRESAVASRLWEYLHFCFYSGNETYTIDYNRLVDYIPLRRRQFASQAMDQLRRPLDVLVDFGVISQVEWSEKKGKADDLRLVLWRGKSTPTKERIGTPVPPRIVPAPERELVDLFYRLHYRGDPCSTRQSDYRSAKQIIDKYGWEKAKALLPRAIERMERSWRRRADSFGAVVKYVHQSAEEEERSNRKRQQEEEEREQRRLGGQQAEAERKRQHEHLKELQAVWDVSCAIWRNEIEEEVRRKGIGFFVRDRCLQEMERQMKRLGGPIVYSIIVKKVDRPLPAMDPEQRAEYRRMVLEIAPDAWWHDN
jgi:hypothetical protein